MNRIERLIWEETQLKEIERQRRESPGMRGAKLILIALLVGLIAVLASRMWMRPLDDAVVRALLPTSVFYTLFVTSNPASDAGPPPVTSSRDTADEMERTAAQDDPSIATFGHQRRFRGREALVAPSSSVQASPGDHPM